MDQRPFNRVRDLSRRMSQLTRRTLGDLAAPARGGVRLEVNVGAFTSLFKRRSPQPRAPGYSQTPFLDNVF